MNTSTRLYVLIIVLVVLWCAGIFAAPILKHAGKEELANICYSFFSRVCHQDDTRSFHLEGEKLSVCIRCSAIYFSFLTGLVLMLALKFSLISKSVRPWIFIAAISPMLVDIAMNDLNIISSTILSRVATGAIFGVSMSWYIAPLLVEACLQILYRTKMQSPSTGAFPNVQKT